MEKFTREYAEKVLSNECVCDKSRDCVHQQMAVLGYMKAIEETNALELLDALKAVFKSKTERGMIGAEEMSLVIQAINKATR
jgi:hypothetical protein